MKTIVAGLPARRLASAMLAVALSVWGLPSSGWSAAHAPHEPLGVKGRWTLVSKRSRLGVFPTVEPQGELLDVTVDDGVRLAFSVRLILDGQVQEEAGDVRLDGRGGWGRSSGATFPGRVVRLTRNSAVIRFTLDDGARNEVRVNRVDPDVLIMEEKLTTPSGDQGSQRLIFVREARSGS